MSTLQFPHSAPDDGERRTIGRYEILHRIGGGSMGVVYLAQDPVIDRLVALKTLSAEFPIDSGDLDSLRRQFLNEAKSAGALSHPGIVTVHDLVDDPETGEVSIAMEYVPGDTLRQVLSRPEPPALEFIADVVRQIAEVLDFAHSKGVVHRDVKPANVILGEGQRVKVADFGIASLGGRGLAGDLAAMGTPSYLAPERILADQADHRADVYSLGVLVYEMLTRHLPFSGETLSELALNTVQQEPTPLATHRPDLVQPFQRLIDRALAKEPEQRYQRAGEIADDLDKLVLSQARLSDTLPLPDVAHLLAPVSAAVVAEPEREEAAAASEGEAKSVATAPPAPAPAATRGVLGRLRPIGERLASLAASARAALHLSSRHRRAALIAGGALLLLVLAMAFGALVSRSTQQSTQAQAELTAEQLRRLEYLALLQQVQQLYDAGEIEVAERLLDEAELISPEAARVRQMREAARRRVADEHAALREAQVVDLVLRATEALERGDLATAGAAVYKALELDPENEAAIEARTQVETRQRRLARAAKADRQAQAAVAEPVVAAPLPPPVAVAVEPVEVAPQPPPTSDGLLRVELRSERPRGVLTVYSGTTQVYRRGYRFVERKGLLRRKGRSGGFDDELRLEAGELGLRVYLSLPGEATQSLIVSGELARGGSATLRVEVDRKGEMTVRLR